MNGRVGRGPASLAEGVYAALHLSIFDLGCQSIVFVLTLERILTPLMRCHSSCLGFSGRQQSLNLFTVEKSTARTYIFTIPS